MNKNNFPILNICKIGFTYVGAVIGAGFASGQEIFQFFVRYGKAGVGGIFLAGGLFILGGVIFLQLARRLRVENYHQIFYKLLGKGKGIVIDLIYVLFILGSISVMLAGSGTIFEQALGINYNLGVLITLIVVMMTIFTGVKGILIFNSLLIPFLTLVIIYSSLGSLQFNSPGLDFVQESSGLLPWYCSAMMYVSFNVFMSLAILSVIGTEEKRKNTLVWGGIVGGGLLTVILLLMGTAMYCNYNEIVGREMPMLRIADISGSTTLHLTYMIGLWFAMITTAVAHVYAFVQRVIPLFNMSYYNSTMLTVIVVLPLTRFGFANLVSFLYPIYGGVTLVVLVMMWLGWRKQNVR